MTELKISGKLNVVGCKPIIEERERDAVGVLFSQIPKQLIDFTQFIKDKYQDKTNITLTVSSQQLVSDDCGTESYYRLEYQGVPHLYVIDDIERVRGKMEPMLEIARGEITRKDFNRFVKYVEQSINLKPQNH